MTLTKEILVNMMTERIGFSPKEGKAHLELLLEILKAHLEKGEDIKISNFGKWTVKDKKSRRGRNPHTGDALEISARRVVTFHPSDSLRDRVDTYKKEREAMESELGGGSNSSSND